MRKSNINAIWYIYKTVTPFFPSNNDNIEKTWSNEKKKEKKLRAVENVNEVWMNFCDIILAISHSARILYYIYVSIYVYIYIHMYR